MTRYAIDAATLLRLVDTDAPVDGRHQLVAPNSIRSDALQLLYDDVREGRRTERDALAAHERMTGLKVRMLGDRVSRRTAWELARAAGDRSLRSAEYLSVARLQADALVTEDPELSAMAAGVVPLAPFAALLEGS